MLKVHLEMLRLTEVGLLRTRLRICVLGHRAGPGRAEPEGSLLNFEVADYRVLIFPPHDWSFT